METMDLFDGNQDLVDGNRTYLRIRTDVTLSDLRFGRFFFLREQRSFAQRRFTLRWR